MDIYNESKIEEAMFSLKLGDTTLGSSSDICLSLLRGVSRADWNDSDLALEMEKETVLSEESGEMEWKEMWTVMSESDEEWLEDCDRCQGDERQAESIHPSKQCAYKTSRASRGMLGGTEEERWPEKIQSEENGAVRSEEGWLEDWGSIDGEECVSGSVLLGTRSTSIYKTSRAGRGMPGGTEEERWPEKIQSEENGAVRSEEGWLEDWGSIDGEECVSGSVLLGTRSTSIYKTSRAGRGMPGGTEEERWPEKIQSEEKGAVRSEEGWLEDWGSIDGEECVSGSVLLGTRSIYKRYRAGRVTGLSGPVKRWKLTIRPEVKLARAVQPEVEDRKRPLRRSARLCRTVQAGEPEEGGLLEILKYAVNAGQRGLGKQAVSRSTGKKNDNKSGKRTLASLTNVLKNLSTTKTTLQFCLLLDSITPYKLKRKLILLPSYQIILKNKVSDAIPSPIKNKITKEIKSHFNSH